jgi:PAS domain S-box-containing protein
MDQAVRPLRLLLVEDNPADAELLLRELRRAGFQPEAKCVDTEAGYLANLHPQLDLVLSDYAMPQFSGLRALELLKERGLAIPFILVSATIGEETAVTAMRSGAADYLLKDRLARLGQAVEHALEQKQLHDERHQAEKAMEQSEHKYRHLFESLSEAAFLIDAKSRRIIDVNLCAEKLLGRTRAEILGMYEAELFPPKRAATYCKGLSKHEERGENPLDEAEVVSRDGTAIPVRVSFAPIELYGRDLVLALMADVTERKRAEEALGNLRRQSELILNSAGEGIYGIDPKGSINFINPTGAEMLGWTVNELLGKPAHLTLHHTRNDGTKCPPESCPIYGSLHDGAKRRVTNDVFWRKDGSSFRVDYVAAPIKDKDGHVTGSIVTFADISEQAAGEARLRLQEQQYRLLFDTNPSAMWVFDTKSLQILAVNEAAIAQYGYSRDEFSKLQLNDLRPPGDVPDLIRGRSVSSPQAMSHFSGQFRHQRKDCSLLLVEVYSGPIIWNGVKARMVTAIDVTERKRAEERLHEQADIINRAHDAIIVRDFGSDLISVWNLGAERLYGWSATEAIGRPMAELIFAEPSNRESLLEQLISAGEFHGEVKHRAKDGHEVVVDTRVTLIRGDDGTPRSVLGISTDITEQKKLETQLLRAQRLESIGTLASGVAHDLNNILTPILMCAEVLKNNRASEDFSALVSLIEESGRRGAAVVKQVLTFARGIEGERITIKPTHLIDEMTDIAGKTFPKSIEITSHYPEDIASIEGDPTQLHQVLLNLSVNARDAMPNGGRLTITAENFEVDEHYASMTPGAKSGPHVMLRVSDTGTGMPRANIEKIFDPFFTTKEVGKGTGLGLSTALGIVKSHGGFLSVYSEIGAGTTFKVFLPAQGIGETSLESKMPSELLKGKGELVLVVDDEVNILQVTKLVLESNGYRVLTANDGPEALALIAQQRDAINLVLTDISMPFMDGVMLIRTIKKMKLDTSIVASTGHGEQGRLAELQSLDVNYFLTKPYNTEKLLLGIRNALDERETDSFAVARKAFDELGVFQPSQLGSVQPEELHRTTT